MSPGARIATRGSKKAGKRDAALKERGESKLFTIGQVVAALQRDFPDVSHSALRFLQREGLIEPVRTAGGHRMFRPGDVERIRQIKEWQTQRLSLAEIRTRLEERDALDSPTHISQRFLDHAVRGETAAAAAAVLLADDLGMPLARIFGEILQPAMYEVGERWAAGELAVGQEHEISEIARDVISELTLRHARVDPDGRAAVAACVAGEHHDLGLRMVMGVLRQRGLRVHFLGADVAAEFLFESVRLRRPDVVILSASLEAHLPALRATVTALRNAAPGDVHPRIVVGGQGCLHHQQDLRDAGITVIPDAGLEAVADQIITVARGGSSSSPEAQ